MLRDPAVELGGTLGGCTSSPASPSRTTSKRRVGSSSVLPFRTAIGEFCRFFILLAVYRVHRGKLGRADSASSRFSTPVLRTDDGRILCDSADIVRYVSGRFAPKGQDLDAVPGAAETERHFHDALGPHTRRVAYATLFEQPELMRQIAQRNVDSLQASVFMAAYPLAKKVSCAFWTSTQGVSSESINQTRREFDAVSIAPVRWSTFLARRSFQRRRSRVCIVWHRRR